MRYRSTQDTASGKTGLELLDDDPCWKALQEREKTSSHRHNGI